MRPVLTPEQMRHVDANSGTSFDTLVRRAGYAVAREASRLMGGAYGRKVVVLAGKGNNGADGRIAAEFLEERGAKVTVFDAQRAPILMPSCDLLIDAAYGTGFRGEYHAPTVHAPVLAVDIPSGIDATTGESHGTVLSATTTVTFGALKPGLLFEPGRSLAGRVVIEPIGLNIDTARDIDTRVLALVEEGDVDAWIPRRAPSAHKWKSGVRAIAGCRGMMGAARLSAAAAGRAGAGIVHASSLHSPSQGVDDLEPIEVVHRSLPESGWGRAALADIERFAAAYIGPGLGRGDELFDDFRVFVEGCPVPLVIDGDGLHLLGASRDGVQNRAADVLARRRAPTILTPHDGEYSSLVGRPVSADRIGDVRQAAATLGCVVLLKGSTTVVADSTGDTYLMADGDERLATAGSGDVLTGIIAAFLARGARPVHAAAAAAFVHAHSIDGIEGDGVVAGDILARLAGPAGPAVTR
jgi:NAD(P)H-hydrate epimerase